MEDIILLQGNEDGLTKEQAIDIQMVRLLRRIGVPANVKGYGYIKEGVILCVDNPDLLDKITTRLYPEIAKRCKTTPSHVERAIRHAVEIAWLNGDIEFLTAMFESTVSISKGKPTNSQFLGILAEEIRISNYLKK